MTESNSALQPPREKSAFEKFLSLFSDVRPGEGGTVALLVLNAFIMLGLYYILKPVREGLILSGFGAVIKSYSSAAQALLFVFVVPAYGAFAARVNRVWLLSGMTLFFISNLVLFILALAAGLNIGVVFYIWLGIFSFMIVSQFWAFANDVYSEEQGKRLFPVVGIGALAGGLVGALLTASVFEKMSDGALMILASFLLGVFILLIVSVNKRETAGSAGGSPKGEAAARQGRRLPACPEEPLPAPDRLPCADLESGEYGRRVHPWQPLRRGCHRADWSGGRLPGSAGYAHPDGVRDVLPLGKLRRIPDPKYPGLAVYQAPWSPPVLIYRAP